MLTAMTRITPAVIILGSISSPERIIITMVMINPAELIMGTTANIPSAPKLAIKVFVTIFNGVGKGLDVGVDVGVDDGSGVGVGMSAPFHPGPNVHSGAT